MKNNFTKVNPLSKEIRINNSKKNCFIIIHGYTGIIKTLEKTAEALSEFYDVYIPRLPGHGTNREDFEKSTWKDWLRKIYEEYLNLKSIYEEVNILGFSMGGVIGSIIASEFDIKKLILVAPAFRINDRMMIFTPFLRFVYPRKKLLPVQYNDKNWKTQSENYWEYNFYNKKYDLLKLQKKALKKLGNIESETFIILSENDKSVPFDVKKITDIKIKNKNYLILKNSPHTILSDCESDFAINQIIEFLKNI